MSDRVIDPARQGIAAPEPESQWAGRAKPVPLANAISMVDAWAPDFGFQLHQIARALREGLEREKKRASQAEHIFRTFLFHEKSLNAKERERVRSRALAAVPCGADIENCHAPYYRHQPCCNLRVALWPGEPFETDYLPDSGEVHLFAPGRGNTPRVSAGCVKLVEPTL